MTPLAMVEAWDELLRVLPGFLVRCGAAALCGAIIGIEREVKGKPAGFRTNILICLGSSMYMAIGPLVSAGPTGVVDPTRIAAQVVTGVGFLGAGAIMQSGGHVTGLTTAATIWVVAAIGVVAGAGYPVLAVTSALIVLLILTVLGRVEERFLEDEQH